MNPERPGRYDDPSDYAIPPALPLTPEQAQAAFDAAPEVMLSKERIQEIVAYATKSAGPQTHEEARQFHEGFLSGATAYAVAVGHSSLKRDNPKLCEVFDAQGWKTIETFERLAIVPVVCEHGVRDGDWCEPCNKAMKLAIAEDEGGAQPLACANCGQQSTVPGQFTPDLLWLCTESCRKELCDKQARDGAGEAKG